jgi:hypothetical protein
MDIAVYYYHGSFKMHSLDSKGRFVEARMIAQPHKPDHILPDCPDEV